MSASTSHSAPKDARAAAAAVQPMAVDPAGLSVEESRRRSRTAAAAEDALESVAAGAEGSESPPRKRRCRRFSAAAEAGAEQGGTAADPPAAQLARRVQKIEEVEMLAPDAEEALDAAAGSSRAAPEDPGSQALGSARRPIVPGREDWVRQERAEARPPQRSASISIPGTREGSIRRVTIKGEARSVLRDIPAARLGEMLVVHPQTGTCPLEEMIRQGLAPAVEIFLVRLQTNKFLEDPAWGPRLQRRCIEWNRADVLAILLQHFDPDLDSLSVALEPRGSPSYARLLHALQKRNLPLPPQVVVGREGEILWRAAQSLLSFPDRGQDDFNDQRVECVWSWLWPQLKQAVLADPHAHRSGLSCWLAVLAAGKGNPLATRLLVEWKAHQREATLQIDWDAVLGELIGIERAPRLVALLRQNQAPCPRISMRSIQQALVLMQHSVPSPIRKDAAKAFDQLADSDAVVSLDEDREQTAQLAEELLSFVVGDFSTQFEPIVAPIKWVNSVLSAMPAAWRLGRVHARGKADQGSPKHLWYAVPEVFSAADKRAWKTRLELLRPLLLCRVDGAPQKTADLCWATLARWNPCLQQCGVEPMQADGSAGDASNASEDQEPVSLRRPPRLTPPVGVPPPLLLTGAVPEDRLLCQLVDFFQQAPDVARSAAEQLRPFFSQPPSAPSLWTQEEVQAFGPIFTRLHLGDARAGRGRIWNALFQKWGLAPLEGQKTLDPEALDSYLRSLQAMAGAAHWPCDLLLALDFLCRRYAETRPSFDERKIHHLELLSAHLTTGMAALDRLEPGARAAQELALKRVCARMLQLLMVPPCPATFDAACWRQIRQGSPVVRKLLITTLVELDHPLVRSGDLRPWILAEALTDSWAAFHAAGRRPECSQNEMLHDLVLAASVEGALERVLGWAREAYPELSGRQVVRHAVQTCPASFDEALSAFLATQPDFLDVANEDAERRALHLQELMALAMGKSFEKTTQTILELGQHAYGPLFGGVQALLAHGLWLKRCAARTSLSMADKLSDDQRLVLQTTAAQSRAELIKWLTDPDRMQLVLVECAAEPVLRKRLSYLAISVLTQVPDSYELLALYTRAFKDHAQDRGAGLGALSISILRVAVRENRPFEEALRLLKDCSVPLARVSQSVRSEGHKLVLTPSCVLEHLPRLAALDAHTEGRELVDWVLDDPETPFELLTGAIGTTNPDMVRWVLTRLGAAAQTLALPTNFPLASPVLTGLPPSWQSRLLLLAIRKPFRETLQANLEALAPHCPMLRAPLECPWRLCLQEMVGGAPFIQARAASGAYRCDLISPQAARLLDLEVAYYLVGAYRVLDPLSDVECLEILTALLPMDRQQRPPLPWCVRALVLAGRWSLLRTFLQELPPISTWPVEDQQELFATAACAGMLEIVELAPDFLRVTPPVDQLIGMLKVRSAAPVLKVWISRHENQAALLATLLDRLREVSSLLKLPSQANGAVPTPSPWAELMADLMAFGFTLDHLRAYLEPLIAEPRTAQRLFQTAQLLQSQRRANSQWNLSTLLERPQVNPAGARELSDDEQREQIGLLQERLNQFFEERAARAETSSLRESQLAQIDGQRGCWRTLFSSAYPNQMSCSAHDAAYWQSLGLQGDRVREQIRGLLAQCALALLEQEQELRASGRWDETILQLIDCARCPTGTVGLLQALLLELHHSQSGGLRSTLIESLRQHRHHVLSGQVYRGTDERERMGSAAPQQPLRSLLNRDSNVHQRLNLVHLLQSSLNLSEAWQPRDAMSATLMVDGAVHEIPKNHWNRSGLEQRLLTLFDAEYQPTDLRWALIDELRLKRDDEFVFRDEVLEVLAEAEADRQATIEIIPSMPPLFNDIQQTDGLSWQRIQTQLRGVLQIPEKQRNMHGLSTIQSLQELLARGCELFRSQDSAEGARRRVAQQLAAERVPAGSALPPALLLGLQAALASGVHEADPAAWKVLQLVAQDMRTTGAHKSLWRQAGILEISGFVAAINRAFSSSLNGEEALQPEEIWKTGYREFLRAQHRRTLSLELEEGLFSPAENRVTRLKAADQSLRLLTALGLVTHGDSQTINWTRWIAEEDFQKLRSAAGGRDPKNFLLPIGQ